MPFLKGHSQSNTGRTHFKKNIRFNPNGEFKKGETESEKNFSWKGETASKHAIHIWVRRRLIKPDICDFCKNQTRLELSNISQEYKRELIDWQWLCAKCHRNYDNNAKKAWITRRKNGTDKFYGNQYIKKNTRI